MKFLDYLKQLFKENKFFFIPYVVFLLCCCSFLVIYSKKDIHIWLNSLNSPFLDKMFPYITFLGDGLFVIIICIIMLLYKFRHAVLIFVTFALSGILVQIMKKFVFFHMLRPKPFFKDIYDLHFVPGVKMYNNSSFPSGHSATAFALFLCLSLFVKNNLLKFFFFITACIIGYSRIYLSQHFLIDVVFGSLTGILTVMVYSYFNNMFRAEWMDMSVFDIRNRMKSNR